MHRKWFLLIGGLVIFWYCVVRQLIDWAWVASRGLQTESTGEQRLTVLERIDTLGKLVQEGEMFVVPADAVSIGRGLALFERAESVALGVLTELCEISGDDKERIEFRQAEEMLQRTRDILSTARKNLRGAREETARRQLLLVRQEFHQLYVLLRSFLLPPDDGDYRRDDGEDEEPDDGDPWAPWLDLGEGD